MKTKNDATLNPALIAGCAVLAAMLFGGLYFGRKDSAGLYEFVSSASMLVVWVFVAAVLMLVGGALIMQARGSKTKDYGIPVFLFLISILFGRAAFIQVVKTDFAALFGNSSSVMVSAEHYLTAAGITTLILIVPQWVTTALLAKKQGKPELLIISSVWAIIMIISMLMVH